MYCLCFFVITHNYEPQYGIKSHGEGGGGEEVVVAYMEYKSYGAELIVCRIL
jgi:hypothetical protein